MTTYSQQRVVDGVRNRRPSDDTLMFGGSTTELERSHNSPSTERFGLGQEERHNPQAIELVTTSFHVAK
jgi:hypothetical protein